MKTGHKDISRIRVPGSLAVKSNAGKRAALKLKHLMALGYSFGVAINQSGGFYLYQNLIMEE